MSKNLKRGSSLPYSVSQNFLTSRSLINRLIKMTDINNGDTVLEIGAGKGHITRALSGCCKNVISYEIDKKLYERVKNSFAENVCLYNTDFLKCSLPKEPYKVFANIPFSRTTEIVRKLTSADSLADGIWLVMERGAAKRFCGIHRSNLNSLMIKPFFESKIIYHFNRADFHPSPNTDVVLLQLKRKDNFDMNPSQRRDFYAFLSHSLKYGLFGSHALLTKKQISTALRLAELPQIYPSGDVMYVQWLCLFRCWLKYGKNL